MPLSVMPAISFRAKFASLSGSRPAGGMRSTRTSIARLRNPVQRRGSWSAAKPRHYRLRRQAALYRLCIGRDLSPQRAERVLTGAARLIIAPPPTTPASLAMPFTPDDPCHRPGRHHPRALVRQRGREPIRRGAAAVRVRWAAGWGAGCRPAQGGAAPLPGLLFHRLGLLAAPSSPGNVLR